MNKFANRHMELKRSAVLAVALLVTSVGLNAAPAYFERSLERGAVEDVTPQQKYRSAIREAGGAYKESLRECAQLSGGDGRECVREAKLTYDRDMAAAKLILAGRKPA